MIVFKTYPDPVFYLIPTTTLGGRQAVCFAFFNVHLTDEKLEDSLKITQLISNKVRPLETLSEFWSGQEAKPRS